MYTSSFVVLYELIALQVHDQCAFCPAFTDTYIRNSGYRLVGTISSGYQQDGCRGGAESERESLADVSRIYCGEMESPVVLCLCDVDVAQADMFAWVDQVRLSFTSFFFFPVLGFTLSEMCVGMCTWYG